MKYILLTCLLLSCTSTKGSDLVPVNNVAGPTGAQGVAGVAGATGAQGERGPQGVAGATGVAGVTGAVGPQGAQGVPGMPGLMGATGAAGVQGPQGVPGVAGAVGAQGPAGVAGPQGVPGPTTNLVSSVVYATGSSEVIEIGSETIYRTCNAYSTGALPSSCFTNISQNWAGPASPNFIPANTSFTLVFSSDDNAQPEWSNFNPQDAGITDWATFFNSAVNYQGYYDAGIVGNGNYMILGTAANVMTVEYMGTTTLPTWVSITGQTYPVPCNGNSGNVCSGQGGAGQYILTTFGVN